jgi:hypothetical protein
LPEYWVEPGLTLADATGLLGAGGEMVAIGDQDT